MVSTLALLIPSQAAVRAIHIVGLEQGVNIIQSEGPKARERFARTDIQYPLAHFAVAQRTKGVSPLKQVEAAYRELEKRPRSVRPNAIQKRPRNHLWRLVNNAKSTHQATLRPPGGNNTLSLDRDLWNLTANDIDRNLVYHGTAPYPLENSLAFDFPVDHGEANIRAVNYLDTPYTVPMTGKSALTVELSVTITGQPIYIYKTASNNTCNSPAKARLYFWSNGTRLGIEFGRWWHAIPWPFN